jgi:hypothetical protein
MDPDFGDRHTYWEAGVVKMNQYIAQALYNYLVTKVRSNSSTRRFFRLDGFDNEIYQQLLDIFRVNGNFLSGQPLWVRTTELLPDYREYTLEQGKSATWYRNHIPNGYALVLIFNGRTSDVQSLKDIYPVTERLLAVEGQDHLINAAFVDYQPSAEQINVIKIFLERLNQKVFQPQLRDLVAFLLSLSAYLHKNPGSSIEAAIGDSLPQFGLFRCAELANKLNTPKGDRLLLDIFRASRLGSQLLDSAQLKTYLALFKKTEFVDDYGGASSEQKRTLIYHFLTEVLTNQDELLQVFKIDWNEVADIFYVKARKTKTEQLQDLGAALQEALENQHFEKESTPAVLSDTLEDLMNGRNPKGEDLDDLLTDYGDSLPKVLKNRLRQLRGIKKVEGTDFIADILHIVVELISPLQGDLSDGVVIQAGFDDQQLGKVDKDKAEALLAFRTMYGGVEEAMPAVQWHLGKLWEAVRQSADVNERTEQEQEGEQERIIKAELEFRVSVVVEEEEHDSANIVWHYRSDGPVATTLAHIQTEVKRLPVTPIEGSLFENIQQRLPIPIYNTCPAAEDISDLDLSRPTICFGAWYREFTSLREALQEALVPVVEPGTWIALERVLTGLEEAWGNFIGASAESGVLAIGPYRLLTAYEELLQEVAKLLRSRREAMYAYRILSQAWIVGSKYFDEWAIVPFLHPLKLHWWYERSRHFNNFIASLLDPAVESPIVDERRFRQELHSSYSSANYPAILALPGRDMQPHYFLPVHELDGYELYRKVEEASLAYGLDPNLVSEGEGEQAAQIAAYELARVVKDYLETYPYVHDGLQIYLVQCRNGALPGLIIEQLKRLAGGDKKIRLSLVVHSIDRGAPLYQRVTEWLKTHEEFTERATDTYFPQVTFKVLQSSYEDLFQQVKDTDIVILPDVLAEKGQAIKAKLRAATTVALAGYLTIYPIQRAPFERNELVRDILLTPSSQPLLLQHFYSMQWAAEERDIVPANETINFRVQVSLQEWEQQLTELHKHFRWVVCYDTTVDRFLLEATLKSSVQVIRYSLGLGVKRRHNLTVSSSYKAQDIVERRLTTNLETLLPSTLYDFRKQVAQHLIAQAKQVSGDIVLRAAGPGVYLNELIGMVVAKHLTERRYLQEHLGALYTWIYLDDFRHWFDHKIPDLLFVAIPREANGTLPLHIEVIETKCISETYFVTESADAQRQVAQGVNRLGPAWASGAIHLDAPYWYDQLYQAVVGNLALHREQMYLWEAFRRRLPKGDFALEMSGHAWVFCYDRALGLLSRSEEGRVTKVVSGTQHIPQYYHHYGRSSLREVLRELVEDWDLPTPPNTWFIEDETPILASESENPVISPSPPPSIATPTLEKVAIGPPETELSATNSSTDAKWLQGKVRDLERILRQYSIQIYPIDSALADVGPSIIRFKLRLRPGEQLSKIQRFASDLARELSLTSTPIIDNVLGTNYVGIDLPRPKPQTVYLLPLLDKLNHSLLGELPVIIGQTPDGQTVIEDLSEFPHLLVAGATNSGKSVFLRSLVLCLLDQYMPKDLRLLIVDPKRTDFSFFNDLPYLIGGKVITDQEVARDMLLSLVRSEMPRRQQLMAGRSLRIKEFNQRFPEEALPPIIAIIDEYAQLISIMRKQEREAFERDLMSLAAVARATGIHLVLATQRPSADIVTGTLKANLPASIAFKVASAVNSRIVIDQSGAENLLGRGDMLFRQPNGELMRLQAPFIDEEDIQDYLIILKRKLP